MSDNYTKIVAKGELTDVIKYKDGRVEVRKDHNLVVNSILNLLMALLKNDSSYNGILYWAVGSGLASWDSSLPSPSPSDTALVNEIGRVSIPSSEIKYIDGTNYSNTPTNKIEISHTFGENDCNGTWREFGIFGGDATSTSGSGIMIDKVNHKILTKTDLMEVNRTLKITLNIVR